MILNIIPSGSCLMRMFVQTLNTIKFSVRIFTFIIFLCVGQSSQFVGNLSSKASSLSELAAFGNISAFSAFKYIIKFQHLLKLKFLNLQSKYLLRKLYILFLISVSQSVSSFSLSNDQRKQPKYIHQFYTLLFLYYHQEASLDQH